MDDDREVLMCAGGPLHGRRLSVPTGLKWFTLSRLEDTGDEPHLTDLLGDGVVTIENIDGIGWLDSSEPPADVTGVVYHRKSFITGEKGLIEVFGVQ